MSDTRKRPKSACSHCGQERWLDFSNGTLFFWCVCGSPIEELSEEGLQEKTGLDLEFLANLGFPIAHLDHPRTALLDR